jgi:glucose-1-phosphate cytidylyltransferase
MKVIILAGGLGTRISEETKLKPKPMVLLDDKPILWHVMNIYASQGFTDFVIAAGYKSEMIQDWINNFETEWNILVVDTGLETQTAGRIRMIANIFNHDQFMVTYGDGVGNINLKDLIDFHLNSPFEIATLIRERSIQEDDFKNSNRLYYLFTAQTLTGALLPTFANRHLINGV